MRREPAVAGRPRKAMPALVAAAACLGAWLLPGQTHAYCRTTTCDPAAEECDPPEGSDCTTLGAPLFWPGQCVGYSIQRDASPKIPFDSFASTTDKSFSSWTAVDCGGGAPPAIQLQNLGPVTCDQAEYNQRGGNANVVMFRNEVWPYANATHTLALTTVTFNTENAEIYDVDMEVNGVEVNITVGDTEVDYDLESIITHEAGHFLGLAHSSDPNATMYARYKRGAIALRSLEPDDIAGVCAVYSPGRSAATCDTTPRHGYQDACGEPPQADDSGCSVHPVRAGARTLGGLALVVGALGIAAARRKRRHRPGR